MIKDQLKRRHLRIRKKISGTKEKPRLCVNRSNKHIYAILINDLTHRVITTVSSASEGLSKEQLSTDKKDKGKLTGKSAVAFQVGALLAEKAKSMGINEVVFDRAGYRYHGRIKAIADGARKGGLKF